MDFEKLKSAYQNAGKESVSRKSIIAMIKANTNPVLTGIKRQLIFESIMWGLFLIVYYDFFDGHLKPLFWNITLIVSVLLLLTHNLLGYRITKHPIQGDNLLTSLKNYLSRIRKYSHISIGSRILAIVMIMGFFFSTVEFTNEKYWSLAFGILIISTQMYLLNKVWSKRKKKVERTLNFFNEE